MSCARALSRSRNAKFAVPAVWHRNPQSSFSKTVPRRFCERKGPNHVQRTSIFRRRFRRQGPSYVHPRCPARGLQCNGKVYVKDTGREGVMKYAFNHLLSVVITGRCSREAYNASTNRIEHDCVTTLKAACDRRGNKDVNQISGRFSLMPFSRYTSDGQPT